MAIWHGIGPKSESISVRLSPSSEPKSGRCERNRVGSSPSPNPELLTLGNVSYPILSSWRTRADDDIDLPTVTLKEQRNSREARESRACHIMSVDVLAGGWRWRYSLYARPTPPCASAFGVGVGTPRRSGARCSSTQGHRTEVLLSYTYQTLPTA